MGWTLSLMVVPAKPEAEILAAIPNARSIHPDAAGQWSVVTLGDEPHGVYEPDACLTKNASLALGEAILLWGDSSSDQWRFERSVAGTCLRKLLMLSDGEQTLWAAAEGHPEPWETSVLWSLKNLEAVALQLEEEGQDTEALQEIWAAHLITPDSPWPPMDATLGLAVLKHYGLQAPQR